MTSRVYWFVIAILAVWRVAHLFYAEDGPWDLFVKLRRAAGEGFWGGLLDCFYCLSLWVSVPAAFFLGSNWKERLVLWPAVSAGAILIERLSSRSAVTSALGVEQGHAVHYSEDEYPQSEDKENEHVLRQK